MKKILVFLLFCFALYAEENATLEQNVSQNLQNSELIKEISNLDNSLKNNIWITRYANYNTYQKLLKQGVKLFDVSLVLDLVASYLFDV